MANGIEVNIDKGQEVLTEEQWEMIADAIAEGGVEALKSEVLDAAMQDLKAEAANYLAVYNANIQSLTNLRNLLKRQSALRKANGVKVAQALAEYQESKEAINTILNTTGPALYAALYSLQDKMNFFLGQKAQTIIVYEGVLYAVDTDQYSKLMKYDYNKTSLTARWNVTQENLNSAMQKVALDDYDEQQLARVEHGYNSALWRYDRSREVRKGVAIVMWRNPSNMSHWNAMSVSARGDIAEAYAAIILTHQETLFQSDVIEEILDIFMLQFVADVDNVSGMLEGDVTSGNMEYAIKSADASALGFTQFKTVANMIKQDDFSQEKLLQYKEKLHKKGKQRNTLYKDLTDQVLQDLIDAHNV